MTPRDRSSSDLATLPAPALALQVHPASAWHPDLTVMASLALAGTLDGPALLIDYRIHGDLNDLKIPPPTDPVATDGLWQHTCAEAFLGLAQASAYREFNFSPSSQWASYAFEDERVRASASVPVGHACPAVSCSATSDTLRVLALIPAPLWPAPGPCLIGLTTVLEHQDGRLSYWALAHPKDRPDFHDRQAWTPLPFSLSGHRPS